MANLLAARKNAALPRWPADLLSAEARTGSYLPVVLSAWKTSRQHMLIWFQPENTSRPASSWLGL